MLLAMDERLSTKRYSGREMVVLDTATFTWSFIVPASGIADGAFLQASYGRSQAK